MTTCVYLSHQIDGLLFVIYSWKFFFISLVSSVYRNDLANIVRRRGHKQIQELLTGSSLKADADFLSAENSLDERLDTPNVFEDPLTGQLNFFFMNGYYFVLLTTDDLI